MPFFFACCGTGCAQHIKYEAMQNLYCCHAQTYPCPYFCVIHMIIRTYNCHASPFADVLLCAVHPTNSDVMLALCSAPNNSEPPRASSPIRKVILLQWMSGGDARTLIDQVCVGGGGVRAMECMSAFCGPTCWPQFFLLIPIAVNWVLKTCAYVCVLQSTSDLACIIVWH